MTVSLVMEEPTHVHPGDTGFGGGGDTEGVGEEVGRFIVGGVVCVPMRLSLEVVPGGGDGDG